MLTIYFKSLFTLERLRSGPSGPYLDGFAHKLHLAGYSQGGCSEIASCSSTSGRLGTSQRQSHTVFQQRHACKLPASPFILLLP